MRCSNCEKIESDDLWTLETALERMFKQPIDREGAEKYKGLTEQIIGKYKLSGSRCEDCLMQQAGQAISAYIKMINPRTKPKDIYTTTTERDKGT